MIELKPCPFCGMSCARVKIGSPIQVICDHCGAEGPAAIKIANAKERAVNWWNSRVTDKEDKK